MTRCADCGVECGGNACQECQRRRWDYERELAEQEQLASDAEQAAAAEAEAQYRMDDDLPW